MKEDYKTILVIIVLIAALFVGVFAVVENFTANGEPSRFTDYEAGIVCYVADTYHGGGIDCLPIGETELKGSDQQ